MLTDYDVRAQLAEYKRAEELGLTRAQMLHRQEVEREQERAEALRRVINLTGATITAVSYNHEDASFRNETTRGTIDCPGDDGDGRYSRHYPNLEVSA